MAAQLSDATRFAVTIWPTKCVWCGRPLAYREMQIEHLIPKYLVNDGAAAPERRAKELAELLELHKLPKDFDLHSEENLAPSCGPCNAQKGDGRPPGVVGILLSRAAEYAEDVRKNATTTMSKQKFQNALGVLSTGDPSDPNFIDSVREHRAEIEELLASLDVEASEVDLGAGLCHHREVKL
jgi:5-methylcytosine-specific restriction endonuclease McrA